MSLTLPMTLEDLIHEFDELGDWESKCEFLMDLGDDLPEMPTELKNESNRVHGCQSNVWMAAEVGVDRTIELTADSDAKIVKGLVAVVLMAYSGRTAEEILATNIESIFSRLGLLKHLSMARRSGLSGMVKRVRSIATQECSGSTEPSKSCR